MGRGDVARLDLNQLTNAEYAVQVVCSRNRNRLAELGTTPEEVATLCRMAHLWWYQQEREEDE